MDLYGKIFGLQEVKDAEENLNDINEDDINDNIPQPNDKTSIAMLGLSLLNDGSLQIVCDWAEKSTNMAKIYGKFLYHINNGDIEQFILKQLEIYANNNVVNRNFVEEIVNTITELKKDKDDQPVISPSNALKIANIIKEDLQ